MTIYRFSPLPVLRSLPASVTALVLLCLLAGTADAAGQIADLNRFPQQASPYLPLYVDKPIADYENQKIYADEYMRNHFAPWLHPDFSYLDLTLDKLKAYRDASVKKQYYTGDGMAFPKDAMAKIADNGAIDLGAPSRPGIAVADADVRVLPIDRPLYPSHASAKGERGLLRLDSMQNSTAKPGEPLAIYGHSKDAAWAFIATGTVVGWVKSETVAFVGAELMDRYMEEPYAVFVNDNVKIADGNGTFLCNAKMGTLLPSEGDTLLLPARDKDGVAVIKRYKPNSEDAAPFPVSFTPRNAARAIDQLMGESYGWGGLSGFRDCSAMTRDYFALFGIWLPRNSADQARTGASVPLKNISVQERPRTIVENGVPFATLIHMPGHIMLYLGLYDGEPVVLHNVWGVRVNGGDGKVGRAVIGRTAVTSLRAGMEIQHRPKSSLFIDNVTGLAFPMASIGHL